MPTRFWVVVIFFGVVILEKMKKVIRTPYIFLFFLVLKVVTYYLLIDVNLLRNPFVLGTVLLYWILFSHFCQSAGKHKKKIFVGIYVFLSVIMFADTMYYNYYNQTASIQQIYQVSNVAKVPSSFVATLIPASFFIIWDIPFAIYYFKKYSMEFENGTRSRMAVSKRRMINIATVFVLMLIAIEPIRLVPVTKINTVGFCSYHVRDIFKVGYKATVRNFWEKEEVLQVVAKATEQTPAATDLTVDEAKLQGIGKGKNVLVIQLEAFQNFIINAKYNGQEITPNLNSLLGDNCIYFDNYYSIIGKGNTADAEFASMNSLYPVMDGECYRLYTKNTYNGLPWKLKDAGYSTYAFHGNEPVFWNRQAAYPYQGIDHFYSKENMNTDDIVGLGISDKSVFSQMIDTLSKEQNKFFGFGISLSSHHPYELDEELQKLKIKEEDEGSKFANYLQSVHYTDEAIGELIQKLKEKGLYENTILAFYGDHHGLNSTMDQNGLYVGRFLGYEYGYDEMMKVPCMIRVPGLGQSRKISTLGCQVDFFPTMAYLMDLEVEQPYVMGQNLMIAKHGFAAFTAYLFEGSFAYDDILFHVSREGIFDGSEAWNRKSHLEIDASKYEEQYNRALELKNASEQVLKQDLIDDYVHHEVVVPEEAEDDSESLSVE